MSCLRSTKIFGKRYGLFSFTLMELLVVIAIIGVIAAMLLPALSKAKRFAQNARCINNVRQLNSSLILYTNEHDGFFPPPEWSPLLEPVYGADYGRWIAQLAPYAHVSTNAPIPSAYHQFKVIPFDSIFYCQVPASGAPAMPESRWTYAMNMGLRVKGAIEDGSLNISDFLDHSRLMTFTECGPVPDALNAKYIGLGLYGSDRVTEIGVPPGSGSPAHGGMGVPIVYLDGHAEFVKTPEFSTYQTNPSLPWNYKAFWGDTTPERLGAAQAPYY